MPHSNTKLLLPHHFTIILSSGCAKDRETSGAEYIHANVPPKWASPLTKSWDRVEKLNKHRLIVILLTQKQEEAQGAGVLLIAYCSKKFED